MPSWLPAVLMFIVVLIFQAGGYFYLVRNHLPHILHKLDCLATGQRLLGERVARIEGALRLPPGLTEH